MKFKLFDRDKEEICTIEIEVWSDYGTLKAGVLEGEDYELKDNRGNDVILPSVEVLKIAEY